jgi:predicted cupin superfamily sugar epimerase
VIDAAKIVEALGMLPHPEGGWYPETWRRDAPSGRGRPSGNAILFLLTARHRSHWHRLDADEVWQYSGGDPVELCVWSEDDLAVTVQRLGPVEDGRAGVQAVVPAGSWQTASSLGAWTLVGCIVTPAFEFEGFELAPEEWDPPVG